MADNAEIVATPSAEERGGSPTAPDGRVVSLPCGALFPDGSVHREAEVVKMTGLVRSTLGRKDYQGNFAKASDLILSQCLRRVGPSGVKSPQSLGRVTIGDRDFLLMEIRRISRGDQLRANVVCPSPDCREKIEVTFNLDELSIRRIRDEDRIVRDGRLCFRVDVDSPRVSALCRFPIGDDQYELQQHYQQNRVDASYRLYARCLVEWGGKPVEGATHKFFEQLDVDVLDAFEDAFVTAQPGPIFQQSVPCPTCRGPVDFTFEGSDFLFRSPRRGRT